MFQLSAIELTRSNKHRGSWIYLPLSFLLLLSFDSYLGSSNVAGFKSLFIRSRAARNFHSLSAISSIHTDMPLDRPIGSRAIMSMLSESASFESSSGVSKFFHSKKSFEEIGLSAKVMDGVMNSLRLDKPSKIQALSFSEVYHGSTCILADQTGSGKTLAYLLPVIQRITELQRNKTIASPPEEGAPYVVVITPTTELALQVSKVVKSIANVLKFRTSSVTSLSDMDSEKKKLRIGAEILVSTPGRLLSLIESKEISLKNVQTMVLDETDVLFMDESFPLQPIGQACSMDTQFVFVTATLPEIVTQQIMSEFPEAKMMKGPGLHRIAPTVEEILVDCSGPPDQQKSPETAFENKRLALLRALEQENESQRTIVFCNTINQCRNVENVMQRVDRQGKIRTVLAYHGAIEAETREENIAQFSRPLLKLPVVLICTDRASRGLDFNKAPVDHVILFDFPQEPSEYVRRVGRTGRAGRTGTATVFVHGRQVAIAKKVVGASLEGKRIDPVPEMTNFESWKKRRPSE